MTKGFFIAVLDKWWSNSNSARNLWKEEPLPQARIKPSRYSLALLVSSSCSWGLRGAIQSGCSYDEVLKHFQLGT